MIWVSLLRKTCLIMFLLFYCAVLFFGCKQGVYWNIIILLKKEREKNTFNFTWVSFSHLLMCQKKDFHFFKSHVFPTDDPWNCVLCFQHVLCFTKVTWEHQTCSRSFLILREEKVHLWQSSSSPDSFSSIKFSTDEESFFLMP